MGRKQGVPVEAAGAVPRELYTPDRTLHHDSPDWGIMLRSLMVIWGVGATFFLLALLLTSAPRDKRIVLVCIDVVAFIVLGTLSVGGDRLPRWTPDLCAYVLYLIVGGIILTLQDPDSPYALFYLWLSVHSFYFLPWRRAAPQVAFIAVDYGAALLLMPGVGFPTTRWAATVLTMIVICTMVALLRTRVDALVTRLAGVARTDPLTGLCNRRAYDEVLEMELARSDRTGQPLGLIVADLDHFKWVNDRFGHPTGDVVLRRVAQELERAQRRVDVAARLGGEEFAVVLPSTDGEGAYIVAERIRRAVRDAFRHDPMPVTMSLGVAAYPDDATSAGALFQAADAALMAAKADGRDRAVAFADLPVASDRPEVGGPQHVGMGREVGRVAFGDNAPTS